MMHRGNLTVRHARAALVVAVLVLFGLTSVGVTSASASEADTIAALVNQARASAGLPGLIHNPAMDSVALQWANHMGAAQSMTHNPDYSTQIPSGWSRAGENVAMGQPTPAEMHTAWMNSAGHRANILGDFTDIGIAFVTVNGTTWGVEDFGKYAGHAGAPAPAPAPAPVSAAAAPAAAVPAPAAAAPAAPAAATASFRTEPASPPSPGSEPVTLSAVASAAQKPFPIGYVLGGILVVIGIGGGIYGQRLRIRGRRPPRF
ncbi:CAP domain-containing protein [Glaciihabitans sp. GrIS 2.15]|uniref:CAP domain-containing protein n=1 Tax=Glaciihabitans sp. GrIS 2.15 TaxID=3071710 RepID=UPI002E0BA05D|nr:hypothetical protein [Glaciihabitans sp. GrIS 2.15]